MLRVDALLERGARLAERLSWTVRQAGVPLFFANATTAASLFINCFSSLPAIFQFGLCGGVLLFVNMALGLSYLAHGWYRSRRSPRVLVLVSGTLQDGFPLRRNLDAPGAPAEFVGWALVRGVKMYLDPKPRGCREWVDPESGERQRVNPALVCTGGTPPRRPPLLVPVNRNNPQNQHPTRSN